jgi:hypothetical protein
MRVILDFNKTAADFAVRINKILHMKNAEEKKQAKRGSTA